MLRRSNDHQKLLADLARVKALFQQRSIIAHLGEMPTGSKADQEMRAAQSEGEV